LTIKAARQIQLWTLGRGFGEAKDR
jgi:hypothetical protein